MNSKLTLITLMILSFMCVSLAFVHAGGINGKQVQSEKISSKMPQLTFSSLDLNNDNLNSKEEFSQGQSLQIENKKVVGSALQSRAQLFTSASVDVDGNGVVNPQNAVKTLDMLKQKINKQDSKYR